MDTGVKLELCSVAFTDKMLEGELMWGKSLKGEVGTMGGDRILLLDRCGCVSPLDSSSREESWMGKTVRCNSRLWGPSHSGVPVAEQDFEFIMGGVTFPCEGLAAPDYPAPSCSPRYQTLRARRKSLEDCPINKWF